MSYYAQRRINRRFFIRSVGALLCVGIKPDLFHISGGSEESLSDSASLVHGPYFTKYEVLARQQALYRRLRKSLERFQEGVDGDIKEACLKAIHALKDRQDDSEGRDKT